MAVTASPMLLLDSAVVMSRLDALTEAVESLTAEVRRLHGLLGHSSVPTIAAEDQTGAPAADRLRSRSKLLRQSDVCRELGVSEQVWVRWRKAGTAPAPANVPGRRLFWSRDDIEQFASQRAAR